jgi:hypothetical protein
MEMKTLTEELEEMRIRMHDLATSEQDLVAALGDALNQADSKLLDDLRNLSSEHEARRAAIVQELQRLASRLGALPVGGISQVVGKLPPFDTPSHGRGDRREHGASSIAEELTKHLTGRAVGH